LVLSAVFMQAGIPFPAPDELLLGFANPALITILALLIIGQALFRTGALTGILDSILHPKMAIPRNVLIIAALLVAMIISAFMNNTPVTVVFIPILAGLMRSKMPNSRYMMSLSFMSVLGGMTTMIGSSTNLLVASTAASTADIHIGFFDFFVPGALLALVGVAYTLFVLPRILPDRHANNGIIRNQGKQYVVKLAIDSDHPFLGAKAVAGMFPELRDITIQLIVRKNRKLLPPYDDVIIEQGDEVVAAATREHLTKILARSGMDDPTANMMLAEAVVAPGSRLEGRTLGASGFSERTHCLILGVQRRARMIRNNPEDMNVEPGDTLLIAGTEHDLKELARDPDILLLADSMGEIPPRQKAPLALGIFFSTVIVAATGLLPIVTAACLGAFVMVATSCIQVNQALRALDIRVIMIVASSVALGQMLSQSGAASELANILLYLAKAESPYILASILFIIVAILTNFLSNNATAVLFTPIAIGLAQALDTSPELFLHATIFAANACFATPMAYQTNLLVMGPGQYKFADFLRGGLPLIIILWLVFSVSAPFLYT